MNAGTSYEKAKRQAQANADTTGKDWVLFTSGGSFQVEQDWATRAFEAEVFRPSPYPKKDCIHPSGLTYAPGASSRACVFCGAHEEDVKSWAPEVIADSSGKWAGNGLRFKERGDAVVWVVDLANRWTLVRDTRVVPSQDEPNR